MICKGTYISSNINEVIRAVLNVIIFSRKDFACTKSVKKHKKKHKKHKNAAKQMYKTLQANKSKKCAQKTFKGKIVTYSLICVFVRVNKRKLEKREKSYNGNVLNNDVPTTQLMY